MKKEILPQYLDEILPIRELEKRENDYIIKAEPHVMELIRRVFHATDEDSSGYARIPATKRNIGDLNWFMMRYPLKVVSYKEWVKDIKEARDYVKLRSEINKKPIKLEADFDFKGTLLDFQKEGLSFIFNNKKCILADEMGLGKTVQALALISKLKKFPVLIVAPAHLYKKQP